MESGRRMMPWGQTHQVVAAGAVVSTVVRCALTVHTRWGWVRTVYRGVVLLLSRGVRNRSRQHGACAIDVVQAEEGRYVCVVLPVDDAFRALTCRGVHTGGRGSGVADPDVAWSLLGRM